MKSSNFEGEFVLKESFFFKLNFFFRQLQTTKVHLRQFDTRRNDEQCQLNPHEISFSTFDLF